MNSLIIKFGFIFICALVLATQGEQSAGVMQQFAMGSWIVAGTTVSLCVCLGFAAHLIARRKRACGGDCKQNEVWWPLRQTNRRADGRHPLVQWLWLPVLLTAFGLRLSSLEPIQAAPPVWYSFHPARPVYNEGLVARVRIAQAAGKDRYRVQVQLESHQKRVWIRPERRPRMTNLAQANKRLIETKRSKPGPGHPKPKCYQLAKSSQKACWRDWYRARRHIQTAAGNRPGQRKRTDFYRQKKHKAWLAIENLRDTAAFPALLTLSGAPMLWPGCELQMRIFGRGVARKANGSYQAYLFSQSVTSSWRASSRYHVIKRTCPHPSWLDQQRLRLHAVLTRSVPEQTVRDSMTALLFGRSAWIDAARRRHMGRTGVMHIFAASGLHLGIIYACLYVPLGWLLGPRHFLSVTLALLPCLGLAIWMDFPVSITRALAFVSLHSLFRLRFQSLAPLQLIWLSMLIVLFSFPRAFVSPGSFLSFAAVSGIVLFLQPLQRTIPFRARLWKALWAQYSLGVSAALFTNPVILLLFQGYPYASQLLNLVLVPVMGLFLPFLYLAAALGLVPLSGSESLALWLLAHLATVLSWCLAILQMPLWQNFYVHSNEALTWPIIASLGLTLSVVYLKAQSAARRRTWLRSGNWPKNDIRTSLAKLILALCLIGLGPAGILIHPAERTKLIQPGLRFLYALQGNLRDELDKQDWRLDHLFSGKAGSLFVFQSQPHSIRIE
ncbi:MAG: ComEC/Rec2 family competence protein [Leptospiraceae bacterium]|nr:ComEC/Rec2 family competence protein [Leptospiraceae bacterium]